MRRPTIIATLLLPLPFAFLPLMSLFFAGSPAPEADTVATLPAVIQDTVREEAIPTDNPVAFNADPMAGTGCGGSSITTIEG
ncbi:MAG: hypothetical protein HY875_07125 [Chloroflexi bacterium]|nr:hypothetical protein [Chloroflexota bacterium]